jgi:FtsP/CotA-like multicopper oxidase with cupredoxin domain
MVIQLLFGFVSLFLMAEAAEVHRTLIIDTIYPYQTSLKPIVSANYSFPGPLIEADEGDTFVIRVINRLLVPSTIHWHGMHQLDTQGMDGAVGVTQCAIPPQSEMIYKFKAEPAGTSWYHGHLLEQYTDGLFGALIIHRLNEPNRYHYDSERILMVSDWYNNCAHTDLLPWYLNPNNPHGNEPSPDAIVVNGKFTQSLFIPLSGSSRVRFRVINTAALSMYTMSIDGLPLHIIELDQTDTLPYSVNSFTINVGQRVSFYIDLNELDLNYTASGASSTNSLFIRFQAMLSMYPVDIVNYIPPYESLRYPYPTFFNPLYLAVLSLDSNNSLPTYLAKQPTPTLQNASTPFDTNLLAARPFNHNVDGIPNATHYLSVLIAFAIDTDGINRGYLNNVTYNSDANYMHMRPDPTQGITSDEYAPLLHQMATKPDQLGIPSPRIEAESQLPTLQSDGQGHYLVPYQAVVDLYLNNTDGGEHPFHLHGHHFWILATSDYPQAEYLYHDDYIQRDVVSVPAFGWAKLRFVANNPGAWFFHCHIEWHMTGGMALAFITSPQQLLAQGYTIPKDQQDLCQALREFNAKNGTNN